jgi:hypothetical protein
MALWHRPRYVPAQVCIVSTASLSVRHSMTTQVGRVGCNKSASLFLVSRGRKTGGGAIGGNMSISGYRVIVTIHGWVGRGVVASHQSRAVGGRVESRWLHRWLCGEVHPMFTCIKQYSTPPNTFDTVLPVMNFRPKAMNVR